MSLHCVDEAGVFATVLTFANMILPDAGKRQKLVYALYRRCLVMLAIISISTTF